MSRLIPLLLASTLAVTSGPPAEGIPLALQSAAVLPDGRILRLEFTGPLPAARSLPDSQPGVKLTLSGGAVPEYIGSWVVAKDDTLTWVASYLLIPAQDEVITIDAAGVTVSAPAGLLKDEQGNASARISRFPVTNGSLVDAHGFTSKSLSAGGGGGGGGDRMTRGRPRRPATTKAAAVPRDGGVALYVSSSHGNDSSTFVQAQNPRAPLATVGKALDLLHGNGQNGKWAAVRLLRGDTFSSGGDRIRTGGPDARHPMVIEDYWFDYGGRKKDPGTRPVIAVDQSRKNVAPGFITAAGGGTPATLHHILIRRLHIKAVNSAGTGNGRTGLSLLKDGTDLTLDDCVVTNFGVNVSIQGSASPRVRGVTLLRCILTDSWLDGAAFEAGAAGVRTQGAFFSNVDDLLLSQCVFDNNGRVTPDRTGRNLYSHNIYISHDCGPATLWGNVIRSGGSHGVHHRCGGVLAYNYLARNALAAELSSRGGSQYKNVVEKAEDLNPAAKMMRGLGLIASNRYGEVEGQSIESNIIVNAVGLFPQAITPWQWSANRVRELRVRNNTIVRAGPISFSRDVKPVESSPYDRVTIRRNLLDTGAKPPYGLDGPAFPSWNWYEADGNLLATTEKGLARWKAMTRSEAHSATAEPVYVNSRADLGSYAASIGEGSEAELVASWRQRKPGAFGAADDVVRIYSYFASQYRPTNLKAIGRESRDYYGAVDYRSAKASGAPPKAGGS